MRKQEVAEYLGISTKTVDRYVKKGFLEVKHKNKSIHSPCEFDREQVKTLKEFMGKGHRIIAKPVKEYKNPQEWYFHSQQKPKIIYDLSRTLPDLKDFIFELIKPHVINLISNSLSELSHKLTLSLAEVIILSGLPRKQLYLDLKKGKLKGVKIGTKWRVRRVDLDSYLEYEVFKKES